MTTDPLLETDFHIATRAYWVGDDWIATPPDSFRQRFADEATIRIEFSYPLVDAVIREFTRSGGFTLVEFLETVADGYAQNYLIPQKLAVPASGGAYRAYQHDIASREDKRKREREDAEIAATRIGSTTLTMGVKVGEGGKLYGSINNQDIAEALGRRGITVDRHKIDLEQPIKSLGTYKVAIKVYSGMTPEVTIIVEPKG